MLDAVKELLIGKASLQTNENTNMSVSGYPTVAFIDNLGGFALMIPAFIVIVLTLLLTGVFLKRLYTTSLKFRKLYKKIYYKIFFTVFLNVLIHSYIKLTISCFITLKATVGASIGGYVILMGSVIGLPVFIWRFMAKNKAQIQHLYEEKRTSRRSFKEKMETCYEQNRLFQFKPIWEGLRPDSNWAMAYYFIFCIRRLIFVFVLVFVMVPGIQMQLILWLQLIILWYITAVRPHDERITNNWEIFNEILILAMNYHVVVLMVNPETNPGADYLAAMFDCGWSFIFFFILFLLVNISLLVSAIVYGYIRKRKRARYLESVKKASKNGRLQKVAHQGVIYTHRLKAWLKKSKKQEVEHSGAFSNESTVSEYDEAEGPAEQVYTRGRNSGIFRSKDEYDKIKKSLRRSKLDIIMEESKVAPSRRSEIMSSSSSGSLSVSDSSNEDSDTDRGGVNPSPAPVMNRNEERKSQVFKSSTKSIVTDRSHKSIEALITPAIGKDYNNYNSPAKKQSKSSQQP